MVGAFWARLTHVVVAGLIMAMLAACAGTASRTEPASGMISESPTVQSIDAVLPAAPTGTMGTIGTMGTYGWRLFQLGQRRHAFVAATPESWPAGTPMVTDWKTLAAPTGAFRPVQAIAGQRGYFHVVDAASARLCLYDADGSLLSTYPLPAEFTPFPAGRAAVFRGADDAFTFIDYGAGEAWQYAERQTLDAGATRWTPRGRVKLPGGTRDCVQPPGLPDLFCRDAAGSPLRFDGALNRIPPRKPGGDESAVRHTQTLHPSWAAPYTSDTVATLSGAWIFTAYVSNGSGLSDGSEDGKDSVLFVYHPLEKTWGPVPSRVALPPGP